MAPGNFDGSVAERLYFQYDAMQYLLLKRDGMKSESDSQSHSKS